MENQNKCWCRELHNLPDEFKCKEFTCARYRINKCNLEKEQRQLYTDKIFFSSPVEE